MGFGVNAISREGGGLVKFLASDRGRRLKCLASGRGAPKILKPTEQDLRPPDVNYGTSLKRINTLNFSHFPQTDTLIRTSFNILQPF